MVAKDVKFPDAKDLGGIMECQLGM